MTRAVLLSSTLPPATVRQTVCLLMTNAIVCRTVFSFLLSTSISRLAAFPVRVCLCRSYQHMLSQSLTLFHSNTHTHISAIAAVMAARLLLINLHPGINDVFLFSFFLAHRQNVQAPVEVCNRAPCLLSPQVAAHPRARHQKSPELCPHGFPLPLLRSDAIPGHHPTAEDGGAGEQAEL